MKTETKIKTLYHGIEVSYIEDSNEWEFELRGRHRLVPSLAKAKEAIDKIPVKAEENKFVRFKAICMSGFSNKSSVVTVTSWAGKGYFSNRSRWWVIDKDGTRSKEEHIVAITDENTARLKRIDEIDKQVDVLMEERSKLNSELTEPPIPASAKEEEEE